ncbi:methyltransferase [Segniliparus rotundus DSM 44985]|uniref:S-adenosyl-L-methionine-dependent methyltransferase n=1 Tax=Segniliparus rotundus (strain ATCC BAA-972 / CDC 1076 / CIP 108378 / DSM 44985 / JCM 13578) TaxID=640132 RepID=D6ZCM7_SEGRD|nr:class I SAM-dependent methyltransferase [Segniliparus rotundus]ADG97069.1 methyltransferase [Segniliparus rotundus DSM 44985]
MTTPDAAWARSEGDSWDIVSSVGLTALGVAAMRALETKRDDRLVEDPYAEHFVRAAGEENLLALLEQPELAEQSVFDPHRHMGVRSKFFDQFFLSAASAGSRQGVVLAAGLDVRAHRLDWPDGQVVFEIDQPQVLAFKREVLAELGASAKSDRREVAVDLREDWPAALKAAGFDPSAPTAWSAEGLLPYLPGAAQDLLFQRVVELSAPGSQIAVESFRGRFNPTRFQDVQRKYTQDQGNPFAKIDISKLFYNDERADPEQWLRERGWAVRAANILELCDEYGVPPMELPEEIRDIVRHMVYFSAVLPR